MRPGQPRSSASSRGVNITASRLGVDDHVGDARDARCGCAPRPRSRARARPRARRRVETEREERDEPFGRLQEAQLARLASDLLADDPADVACAPRRRPRRRARARPRSAARGASAPPSTSGRPRGSRARPARRPRAPPRASNSPGSFRCSDTSVRPSSSRTLMLCTSRTRGDAERGGLRAIADARRLLRLDVHDDVASRQRACTASSTRRRPRGPARRRRPPGRRSRRRRTGVRRPRASAGA